MEDLTIPTQPRQTSVAESVLRAIGCRLMLLLGGAALLAAVFVGRFADIEVLVFFGVPGILCTIAGIIFAVAKNKYLLSFGALLTLAHFGAIGYLAFNWVD